MKIVALLSWYDESPSWLSTCVTGIGRFADYLIAVDGAYMLFPSARPRSHPQQAEAIVHTAEAAGLGLLLHQPKEPWRGNEVAKRNHCLTLASTVCEEGDWVTVVDADYHLLKCNPDMIRKELEETDAEVASYTILDGKDFMSDAKLAAYANHNDIDTEWTIRTRDLYRWNPTLRVGPAHWCYSAEIEGGRRWLRGPYTSVIDCWDLNSSLVFYHRTQDRAKKRQQDAGAYYTRRAAAGIEDIASYGEPVDADYAVA